MAGGFGISMVHAEFCTTCQQFSNHKIFVWSRGERDVHTATTLDVVATTNCGGAGKWKDEFSEVLRIKNVTIIADADEAGRKHAQQVARSLHLKARIVKVVELPGAKDLTEWVSKGFDARLLLALGADAPTWTVENWFDLFDTPEEIENAPPLRFAIEGFLQCDAATLIAGLSGDFKTWLALSILKGLLDESTRLWDTFRITHKATRCIYLIPESGRGPLRHRLEILGLMPYVRNRKLLVRTLSKGPAPLLQDPKLLAAAEGADIFLDTAVRFMQGDENNAGDNARGLASDTFCAARCWRPHCDSARAFAEIIR